MARCDYQIVSIDLGAMTIKDLNRGRMSLTNDIDQVVKELLEKDLLLPGMRLFYYDSDGELDEVGFTPKGFTGFKMGMRG